MYEQPKAQIVLDAMGVIYAVKDDVAELLVPFIAEHGGAPAETVETAYHAASLGTLSEDAFWREVGLTPDLEDSYLSRFRLVEGCLDFVNALAAAGRPAVVLTNDVGRWSAKLRQIFHLELRFPIWVVSAEVGCRKPDPAIYAALEAAVPSQNYVFVDDRCKNLDAAAARGWKTVLFRPEKGDEGQDHRTAEAFPDLEALLLPNADARSRMSC